MFLLVAKRARAEQDDADAPPELILDPSQMWGPNGRVNETLLRARAIENGAFVVAAAQGGLHPGGRATFGHSLIIDPWGTVLAEGGVEHGLQPVGGAVQVAARGRGGVAGGRCHSRCPRDAGPGPREGRP